MVINCTAAILFSSHIVLNAQQEYKCLQAEFSPSFDCGFECFRMQPEEIALMPIMKVSVDFHFVRSGGEQFQCSDANAAYYAPNYVAHILGRSNSDFSNPEPNQLSPAPVIALSDTRFRVELFGNPQDPCDAIFLHDVAPTSFSNPDAMHIIIVDENPPGGVGGSLGTNMTLFNIHHHVFSKHWEAWQVGHHWGETVNHELGHRFGLCHAFSSDNTCPDIDPSAECGGPTPGTTTCKNGSPCPPPSSSGDPQGCGGTIGNNCLWCHCTYNTGNNFMGYNTPGLGITRSQWAQMYGSALEESPRFVTFGQGCEDVTTNNPLVIPANTIQDWDHSRVINQDIEIESGATLIIRCKVFMGKERSIVVKTGARLFVLGGEIRSQSPDCRWRGVRVYGSPTLEQPDPAIAKDETQMLDPDGAGVVWLNGAIMRNAICAVSTRSEWFTDYGGLVMVYGSDFIDNGRAVEFMKYGKKNKSYFSYVQVYKSGNSPLPVTKGVSIWGCHGIKFFETHFNKISSYGVLGIDFSAELENCSVKEGDYGYRTESTMPNVAESETIIKNCHFEKLDYGVYANSTPNMIYPLFISDGCRFSDGNTGASWGVRIAGESRFEIVRENFFDDHLFSVHTIAAGITNNKIHCNYFESFIQRGINVVNNNSKLTILGNQFLNPSGIEIGILGSGGQLGQIAQHQGSAAKEAGNCFDNPISAINAPQSSAALFRYYVHQLLTNPVLCKKPTNNLFDGGVNNYDLSPSTQPLTFADCENLQFTPPIGESDLGIARQNTTVKKAVFLANPQSQQASWEYFEAEKWQEYVLQTLVKAAYEADNTVYAEYLLLGENTNTARRWVVGMRTQRGDIAGAQNLLNSMADENQDDVWFKNIMAINFAIALSASPVQYQLTAQQETILHTIAGTHHSLMQGYACALLSFCKDYTCTDDDLLQEMGIAIPERNQEKTEQNNAEIRVFPNPSSGQWTLECPDLIGETLHLELFNLAGASVITRKFVNRGTLTFETELPEGIYFLRLFHNGIPCYSSKLVLTD
jgi:hypothetical protein